MAFGDKLARLLVAVSRDDDRFIGNSSQVQEKVPLLELNAHSEDTGDEEEELFLQFFEKFMLLNRPCLLSANATKFWKSRNEWVESDGKPDFDYLQAHFGSAIVPVADCNQRHYNAQLKSDMTFSDYIQYLKALIASDYDLHKHGNLYLKDWHFTRQFPDYHAYETPSCFTSDWLNEFWSNRTDCVDVDDYKFVYIGPKGSWTPLHTDVFHSFSWSANICGLKRWIIFPPEEEENLKDFTGKLAYDVDCSEMRDVKVYPNFHKVKSRLEVIQKPGEIIFVPSKWLHQVHNLDNTISINHNWFNGCNVDVIWQSMLKMYREVQNEISDCRDMDGWEQQCQLILKSTHGMDFEELLKLLLTVARRRVEELVRATGNDFKGLFAGLHGGHPRNLDWRTALLVFDLSRIRATLRDLAQTVPSSEYFAEFSAMGLQ